MKLLLVDNYDSFTFNLFHLLEKVCEGAVIDVIRNDQIDAEEAGAYDAIILSPGPGIPSEAGNLCNIINAHKFSKPLLGVCLGHQAIAECFGNKLKNLSTVYHGLSTSSTIEDKSNVLFRGMGDKIEVGRYHSWVVEGPLKGGLKVTARSADGEIMAFSHNTLPVHGVQFHPESILTEKGEMIIRNWFLSLKSR